MVSNRSSGRRDGGGCARLAERIGRRMMRCRLHMAGHNQGLLPGREDRLDIVAAAVVVLLALALGSDTQGAHLKVLPTTATERVAETGIGRRVADSSL